MKIPPPNRRSDAAGMAVIVVIALLAIILFFIAANLRTVHGLRTELRLVERGQTNRLARAGVRTNAPPLTNSISASQKLSAPLERPLN